MTDTSRDDTGGVLRPFEETPIEPLPPVEPSKVVPVDRMPQVPDSITPEDVIDAPYEPPVEAEVEGPAELPVDVAVEGGHE
nr:hypothetical protein [Actinomycetota bacterium]NIS28593.1 hypothetical protein [Actinomycetota bacterium]NIT94030.1 hypothetical protein [Actinomycetota bacterium]NIU17662.1 hypothetical protein [Actinomycetota bacterium]NIU64058.1 hypothetical protein [Actinomycetota bacterium]